MKKKMAQAKAATPPVKRAPTSSVWNESHGPVQDIQTQIAARAYELYEQRGCVDGYHLHDWLEAEREILGQAQEPDRTTVPM